LKGEKPYTIINSNIYGLHWRTSLYLQTQLVLKQVGDFTELALLTVNRLG